MPEGLDHLQELKDSGVLDPDSFDHFQASHDHFVEIVHRGSDGELKSLRGSGNLRNNTGGDWQAIAMGGDVAFGDQKTSTGATATTLTVSGTPWSVNQWAHHIVAVGANSSGTGSIVFAPILSNTNAVLTVDRWYTAGATIGGAAGTTPNATSQFQILGGSPPLRMLALSNDSGAPSSADTSLTGELSTNGLGRAEGTFAHTAVTGTQGTTVTSTYTLAKTFTATGTQTSIQKCSLFYSIVAATGTPMFENTFSSVNVISGDTLAVTWTINI